MAIWQHDNSIIKNMLATRMTGSPWGKELQKRRSDIFKAAYEEGERKRKMAEKASAGNSTANRIVQAQARQSDAMKNDLLKKIREMSLFR